MIDNGYIVSSNAHAQRQRKNRTILPQLCDHRKERWIRKKLSWSVLEFVSCSAVSDTIIHITC